MSRKSQSGQIGLVVLLIMTSLLTVGISAVARSTQDIKITRQEIDSSQVFQAAEAGIETALGIISQVEVAGGQIPSDSVQIAVDTGVDAQYTITGSNTFEMRVEEGEVVSLNTSGVTGLVTIEWADNQNCSTTPPAPSLVALIYNSTSSSVRRVALLGSGCASTGGINPATAISGGLGNSTTNLINLVSGEDLVRFRLVGGGADVRVNSANPLPTQYYEIRSDGSRESGSERRSVLVRRSLPTAPTIFDFSVFSGTTLTK